MEVGIKGKKSVKVVPENTAEAVGSGFLPVFSTPALTALMEGCCAESVAGYLPDGDCTVGISLDVRHTSATPVSMTVAAESELTAVDGRKLTFSVTAYDEAGQVGSAVHERFIVTSERFMKKANSKLG